jgi:phosphoribosylanthranilate isomerase
MIRVKVCCITDETEAALAVRYGANAVGLVSEMPSGPGVIGEDRIAHIAAGIPSGVATFLLTSRRDAPSIVAQQRRCGVSTLQLVDAVPDAVYGELRAALPGIRIVQAVHVAGPETVAEARRVGSLADALLLDSGAPAAAVKELGGTGRTHDWALSREIVDTVDVPVYLAGGLRPDNVTEAIRSVQPFGVDVCSGLRTADRLDEAKLHAFMAAVRAA